MSDAVNRRQGMYFEDGFRREQLQFRTGPIPLHEQEGTEGGVAPRAQQLGAGGDPKPTLTPERSTIFEPHARADLELVRHPPWGSTE